MANEAEPTRKSPEDAARDRLQAGLDSVNIRFHRFLARAEGALSMITPRLGTEHLGAVNETTLNYLSAGEAEGHRRWISAIKDPTSGLTEQQADELMHRVLRPDELRTSRIPGPQDGHSGIRRR